MEDASRYIKEGYSRACDFLERDNAATQLTIYGTTALMLTTALLKRRPLYLVRQFKKPEHIPGRLINEGVMHTGVIADIEQRGQDTLLLIKHRPLIPIFTSSKRLLPVKLPGVKISANGYSWLQSCLIGKEATFLPLNKSRAQDYVLSQLCLVHSPNANKLIDVSETLLKLRFAKFEKDAAAELKRNAKYYNYLKTIERRATQSPLFFKLLTQFPALQRMLNDFKKRFLPKQQFLPELVR